MTTPFFQPGRRKTLTPSTSLSQLTRSVNLTGPTFKEHPASGHFSPLCHPGLGHHHPVCIRPSFRLRSCLSVYTQHRVICLNPSSVTDASAQKPALALGIKYLFTHVELPVPPRPGTPLPLHLPFLPLPSHLLCSSPAGLSCSAPTLLPDTPSARNILSRPLRLLYFSP